MEGRHYSLERAQDEANDLRQKKEGLGRASTYQEAHELVLDESISERFSRGDSPIDIMTDLLVYPHNPEPQLQPRRLRVGRFETFQKAVDFFKPSAEELNEIIFNASLAFLSQGDMGYVTVLERKFSHNVVQGDSERLVKAGEAGLVIALERDNLQLIISIQQKCHLPPDFFKSPEILGRISRLLANTYLIGGDIERLQEYITLFALPDEACSIMDAEVENKNIQVSNPINFIKYLGDEILAEKFPRTFLRVREKVASSLVENEDLADYFVENLSKYHRQPWAQKLVLEAIKHYSVAMKLVGQGYNFIGIHELKEKGGEETVWTDEAWFVGALSNAKEIVAEHQKLSGQGEKEYPHGHEGFQQSDPYENHQWRFDSKQILISEAILKLMEGRENSQVLGKLGIDPNELSPLLAKVNDEVNMLYEDGFLSYVQQNKMNEEDKNQLLSSESHHVRMTPLLKTIRSLIARYITQMAEGDVSKISSVCEDVTDLRRIISTGFERYFTVNDIDIPLYDKLYEEFDALRETGRYPLEVYLGRDGIYAWVGRRSQDVSRRRKMGLGGRKKLRELGEIIEIHPRYTVYPRYFRDNLNYETKRQFLEQEGISPDADPLFYDTGYTGTIPEQIMRVMDFDDEDIEQRIRLLSAPSAHRRVKGIPENARSEIIEHIEHNAKTEETAEGLIIDEKTGKIRHVAKPTHPEEQFYFMMVKQAISRHYWLQEQLHHEPSGNVNLDSEHYTIRIRQEYAKLLPSDFMRNPKEFLTQQGELLKGGKGEGKYPDEEIVLFKMIDGTEIVAKKIELRKTKEARKEFSILISAKKAGLQTAEPVGFLSGKEEEDGSYLLMKKLEGRSGRTFEKELRESGKHSDAQIEAIMQQVTEKNREIAELFRTTLKIDKRWKIKDTIIEFNDETREVGNVIPIDWERAQNFNPKTPKEIDELT